MTRNIKLHLTNVLIGIQEEVTCITLNEVLEAVLLSEVNELLGELIATDDWVTSCGPSCYIISSRVLDLNIEVHEASCAPCVVIFGKIVTGAITNNAGLLALFDLIDGVVQAEVDIDGIVGIFRFNGKGDGASETI